MMRKSSCLAAVLVMSPICCGQAVAKPQALKETIEKIRTVSPQAAENMALMRQILAQGLQTGSAFFRVKVGPLAGQAWTALHDFISIQLSADLITAKRSHPQDAKDVARALGDFTGGSDNAAHDFDVAEIQNIPAARPFDGLVADVYQGLEKLLRNSADSDWPSGVTDNDTDKEIQALEGISPKGMKDLLMTRRLVRQAPTKTGNAVTDGRIADAKKLAVDSLTNWIGMELFADLSIAWQNKDKNANAALRVISGPKYATDKAAFDSAFASYSPPGPVLGVVTMSTWGWLAPEVRATVVRLIGATAGTS